MNDNPNLSADPVGSSDVVIRVKAKERSREDNEANLFAMNLLMPEDFVREEIRKMGGTIDLCNDKAIERLAKKFKVSVTMMVLRLGQISNRPLV